MKTFALILAVVSAALCLYGLFAIDLNDEKLAWHILQPLVFAINSFTFFMYWRRASRQQQ